MVPFQNRIISEQEKDKIEVCTLKRKAEGIPRKTDITHQLFRGRAGRHTVGSVRESHLCRLQLVPVLASLGPARWWPGWSGLGAGLWPRRNAHYSQRTAGPVHLEKALSC